MIQFNRPKLRYGCNPSALYKMEFSTGHFYIGSSKHVKTRFSNWCTFIKRGIINNKFMADVLSRVAYVNFIIIEEVNELERLKKETEYIDKEKDNIFLLNRRLDAMTNKGLKELPERLRKIKRVYIKKGRTTQILHQYSLQGEYIKSYNSIAEAALAMNVKPKRMQEHFRSSFYVSGLKGFIFKKKFCTQMEILSAMKVK